MSAPISLSVAVGSERGTAFERRVVVPGQVVAAALRLLQLLAVLLVLVVALAVVPPVFVGIVALALLFTLPAVVATLFARWAGRL
ncbi:hypothetical protein ACFPYI_11325 [Halomarina salina]|uniref:Uncharacterized protein n=1 Tax=Halomarina salina TaxID=1872699 RepID=A0ABD5RNL3_9EURY|nr:hypothetical protein [Halomarina salina]